MSFSRTLDSRQEDEEDNISPTNPRAQTLSNETLFQFFRKKSKRDLDKSYSSARKSGKVNEKNSPNVKLLKELNTSSSPFKGKRPNSSASPFKPATLPTNQSPFRLLTPFKDRDSSSSDQEELSKKLEHKKSPSNPLFVKLIQNGSHRRKKSDIPTCPPLHDKYNVPVSREKLPEKSSSTARLSSQPDLRIHEDRAPPAHKHPSYGHRFSTPSTKKVDDHEQERHNTATASTYQHTEPDRRVQTSVGKENPRSHINMLNDINTRLATYANSHVRSSKKYGDMIDDLDAELRMNSPGKAKEEPFTETLSKRTKPVAQQGGVHVTPKRNHRSSKESHTSRSNWAKNTLGPYIEDYEHKHNELSDIVQRQFQQISRLNNRLDAVESFEVDELKVLVEDLEMTTMTISRSLKDGLFNVHGSANLVEKVERQYKKEIRELNEALEHTRATLKSEKYDHDLKLEELLNYNDNLKKQASAQIEKARSHSREERGGRRRVEEYSSEIDASMEVMRNDIRQLNNRNQDLEIHAKELEKENQSYRQQNYRLKESEEALKNDVAGLRLRLDDALLRSVRQQLAPEKKGSSKGHGKSDRNRHDSPGRSGKGGSKKSGRNSDEGQDDEATKSEMEYLKYRLEVLTKENEDLVRRLTDKVFIERENKTLLIKNQELTEALKSKVKENDHLTKSLNDLQDRVVEGTGYPIYTAVAKHYAPDDKARNRLTHW